LKGRFFMSLVGIWIPEIRTPLIRHQSQLFFSLLPFLVNRSSDSRARLL